MFPCFQLYKTSLLPFIEIYYICGHISSKSCGFVLCHVIAMFHPTLLHVKRKPFAFNHYTFIQRNCSCFAYSPSESSFANCLYDETIKNIITYWNCRTMATTRRFRREEFNRLAINFVLFLMPQQPTF